MFRQSLIDHMKPYEGVYMAMPQSYYRISLSHKACPKSRNMKRGIKKFTCTHLDIISAKRDNDFTGYAPFRVISTILANASIS